MAHINEEATWDDGVYQLETTDPVQGGADGVDNLPHKTLANRTLWLKEKFENIGTLFAAIGGSASKRFKVANAVEDNEAVSKGQMNTSLGNYASSNHSHDYAASNHSHDYSNTFLGKTAKASDSDKLDGQDSSYFAIASQKAKVKVVAVGNVYANSRYVITNPFGNSNYEKCIVRIEIYNNGRWSEAGWYSNGVSTMGTNGYSNAEGVVIQTGNGAVGYNISSYQNDGFGKTSGENLSVANCRAIVFYIGEKV